MFAEFISHTLMHHAVAEPCTYVKFIAAVRRTDEMSPESIIRRQVGRDNRAHALRALRAANRLVAA